MGLLPLFFIGGLVEIFKYSSKKLKYPAEILVSGGKMIHLSALLQHYKKKEIQKAIVDDAKDKEVAVKFGDKGFGKRPDIIQYPNDVLELAKQGATSFHASEELWTNPLRLEPTLKREELNSIRKGWDLVLDIDCEFLEYSKIAAHLIVQAIKYQGIGSVSVKFSGNHGFHIAVPFEAFPEKVIDQETKDLFPDGARAVAAYLQEMIRKHLSKEILKIDNIDKIMKKTGKKFPELIKNNEFDPFKILAIDTVLISSRHLYRMPYCFNEKSGLISIPLNPEKILDFEKEMAKPENVVISQFRFLDREKAKPNEANKLLIQAFDFYSKEKIKKTEAIEKIKHERKEDFDELEKALPADLFPPCIKEILKGIGDGRKRSVFILTNFLSSVGWSYESIEELLRKWNQRNKEPLRDVYLIGQLRYHKQHKKKILPPNCINAMYYKDLQFCKPDSICEKIKNPVNYSKRKAFAILKQKQDEESKGKREKLTEEQKDMRRKYREGLKQENQ